MANPSKMFKSGVDERPPVKFAKDKFTKYIGQTKVTTGIIFHYINPDDKSNYPKVESIYLQLPFDQSALKTEVWGNTPGQTTAIKRDM